MILARVTGWVGVSLLASAALLACSSADGPSTEPGGVGVDQSAIQKAGALVRMDMSSQVAVLLDDIAAGPQREAAAASALAETSAFWTRRATNQAKLSYYKLVFRGLYYPSAWGSSSKARGPLPLPPKKIWNVIVGTPRRSTDPQHDMVVVDYTFKTHMLTGANDPGDVEPNLATIGGTWDEPFTFPADPELLLERDRLGSESSCFS